MRLPGSRLRRALAYRRDAWSLDEWTDAARYVERVLVVAEGGTAYQGGYGSSGSRRDARVSLQIRQVRGDAEVEVEPSTEQPWPDEHEEWVLTRTWLHRARPEQGGFPLRLEADRWEQSVPVDGVERPFVFVGNARSWVAAGTVQGNRVEIGARDWPSEGLALRSVPPGEVSDEIPEDPGG